LPPEYFRDKMRESRERKHARTEELRRLLLASRSAAIHPAVAVTNEQVAGLHGAIDYLQSLSSDAPSLPDTRPAFDFDAYHSHLLALTKGCVVDFEGISPLIDDRRLDRVFRFITAIFMDQEGCLEVEQRPDGVVLVGT
jgi:hypothetical protein